MTFVKIPGQGLNTFGLNSIRILISMKTIRKVLFITICMFLLFQLSCKDDVTEPEVVGTWESLGLEKKLVTELKLIDQYLYACAGSAGLYRLDLNQSGSEWEYLGLADTNTTGSLKAVVTDVISVNGYLLTGYSAQSGLKYSGIYKSTDNGKTWFPSDNGMNKTTKSRIRRLVKHQINPDIVFAATSIEITYKSIDGGETWTNVYGGKGGSSSQNTLAFNPENPREIWVGGETARMEPYLLNSTDEGESWSDYIRIPDSFPMDNEVYDIAIAPVNENIYFSMRGAIGKSTDKGKTFERILGWEDGYYAYRHISINPQDPDEIFTTGFNLYRTKNGGESWQKITPPVTAIYALAVDWQKGVLYVSISSQENSIYKYSFN